MHKLPGRVLCAENRTEITLVENILLFLFIVRPVIDLAWGRTIFMNLNLAGLIAVFTIVLTVIYFIVRPTMSVNVTVYTGILYAAYIGYITILNFTALNDLDYTLRLMSELAFLIVVAPRISHEKLNKCILLFTIMTLIPIFITYFQAMGIVPYTYFDWVNGVKISRGSGGYRQPSVLTRFCSVGLLYTFYLFENEQLNRNIKRILGVYIALNITAVFLSYHRTGYLLVLIEIVLWIYLKNAKKLSGFICKALIATVLILIVFGVIYKLGLLSIDLSTVKSMLSISNIFTISDGKITFGLRGRGRMIETLKLGFAENPWFYTLFGNGVAVNAVTGIGMTVADMEFIRVLWNGGVVGMCIWLVHFISLKKAVARYKNVEGVDSLYRLATCMFWIFIIWGLTIEATNSPNLMYHVYLICGVFCYKSPVTNRMTENSDDEYAGEKF